jgi:DNA-binding HxlR family transcriptional regulator
MRQTSFAGMNCSMARSLEVIGDWWTPLILRDLYIGIVRFDELATDLEISRNLLSTRLAALVEDGIVERHRYQEHPPRHEYALTEAGRDLVPVLMALTAWGDRWVAPSQGPPVQFRHHDCGEVFAPEVRCSHCHELVTAEHVDVLPGPGGRAGRGTRLMAKALRGQESHWGRRMENR